jgi:hypothetical protein
MKIDLNKSLLAAGLMSLSPALWALAPNGGITSSAPFITQTQSTTIYGGFSASYTYDESRDEYSPEDPIVGYDVYVDGSLTQAVGGLYSSYESFQATYAGSNFAQGTHYVEVIVYTASGDYGNFFTSFDVGDLGTAYTINLQSFLGYYVCTEGGGGREVVANRTAPYSWETFTLFDVNGGALESGDTVFIQGPGGQFFCAEGGGGSNMVANRLHPGPWEQFTIEKPYEAGSISSGNQVGLRAFNGQYMCAEEGGGDVVNANRDWLAAWETFTITLQ